jgi:hypothetical protein
MKMDKKLVLSEFGCPQQICKSLLNPYSMHTNFLVYLEGTLCVWISLLEKSKHLAPTI